MRLKMLKWLIFAALCCFCVSCAGNNRFTKKTQEDIDKYLQENPDLPVTDKTCLEEGRFEIGMLKGTLLFLLKEPSQKKIIKQKWATQEEWIYRIGGKKTFIIEDNYVVGILDNR